MNLPTRILRSPPDEPVISVDGAFGAEGLELSHWPGNRTPAELRHDLSTGCALAFARLPGAQRERLAGGATMIVNNHYDTDGACAVFATRHPERALPRAERLLATARAGDFFEIPDFEALALDAIVGALDDPERSPLAAELRGAGDLARWEIAQSFLLETLPDLLDGDLEPYRDLWQPAVDAAGADLSDLGCAERRELPALDLASWTAPRGGRSSRDGAGPRFDPGRHALFGSTGADRALAVGPGPEGTTYRLVVSTRSWFDLPTREPRPRPDLEGVARRLNELEGARPEDPIAWRAQPASNASPELWHGGSSLESFAEHNPHLAPSRLAPDVLMRVLAPVLAAG